MSELVRAPRTIDGAVVPRAQTLPARRRQKAPAFTTETLTGDKAAVVEQINRLGDAGRLEAYRKVASFGRRVTYEVDVRAIPRERASKPLAVRRGPAPAVVWTLVLGGLGFCAAVAYALIVLVEAIAANMALIVVGGLVILAAGTLVGRKCVITVTHRH